ncbi:phosphatidate cytidylyltransferase, mitochondrial-like [Acanthaster planci]|uniref:Phosphatidate cytidylyltransferase, mitochondrial n=1 Tax=Acanthaster planci TaxID=133434 RepID=A0A8B7XK62_ACAPL|nr:phosphatidate cytidylyltransferase, mitochondrial-like [Acanthaster planci]XP_022081194.1 phosphatidate cytidylyltransferase, mitochondrial-like [Acanthaster planci]XP_022081195.1 phosphatidate cytidylyltransferase, mitochondrial-like [Acanthaster planci]XP_022081196.1 phosphatidate cytidylyltransferase, mitochondrial-like [Acanthaster planci]XP_022081200.1 phosphatidate cytidylyltransferase, mitochondrial-like [Acanthaster planci]XP_022081201.1 phosphatidate cytidylyltransferase, mitochond
MAVSQTNRFLFTRILSNFPRDMTMAFAYGSGVFKQIGNRDKDNMIDFIFVVGNATDWHEQNLRRNPDHYSGLRLLGARNIASIQENIGASVYFNTLVRCEDRLIKYGVVSRASLIKELINWDTLYLSGRLHKPVSIVQRSSSRKLYNAIRRNLQSAFYASLLQLPESFTEEQLFLKIAGLSYQGDFRMVFGEDKNKVSNIVKGNLDGFRSYYHDMLDNTEHIYWDQKNRTVEQDRSPACLFSHLSCLPRNLQLHTARLAGGASHDVGEVLQRIAREKECSNLVARGARSIVRTSSITQSIKGIFTAGILKSANYSLQKLAKMWKGGLLLPR